MIRVFTYSASEHCGKRLTLPENELFGGVSGSIFTIAQSADCFRGKIISYVLREEEDQFILDRKGHFSKIIFQKRISDCQNEEISLECEEYIREKRRAQDLLTPTSEEDDFYVATTTTKKTRVDDSGIGELILNGGSGKNPAVMLTEQEKKIIFYKTGSPHCEMKVDGSRSFQSQCRIDCRCIKTEKGRTSCLYLKDDPVKISLVVDSKSEDDNREIALIGRLK